MPSKIYLNSIDHHKDNCEYFFNLAIKTFGINDYVMNKDKHPDYIIHFNYHNNWIPYSNNEIDNAKVPLLFIYTRKTDNVTGIYEVRGSTAVKIDITDLVPSPEPTEVTVPILEEKVISVIDLSNIEKPLNYHWLLY